VRTLNALLIALVVLQRLAELALSRRNTRRLAAQGVRPAADPVFAWMVFAHVLLLVGCLLEPWLADRPFLPALGYPALAVFLTAQALRLWVVRTLGAHWNVRILRSGERGIVSAGPYRWVRHPNYAVVLLETLSLPLVHTAWVTWLVVLAVHTPVLARRIRDEERVLAADPLWRSEMAHKPRFVPWPRGTMGRGVAS
jgi:methyltransferase